VKVTAGSGMILSAVVDGDMISSGCNDCGMKRSACNCEIDSSPEANTQKVELLYATSSCSAVVEVLFSTSNFHFPPSMQ
jgi:hypothetical protein